MSRNKLSVYNETFCSPPPLVTSNMSSLVQRERDTEGFSGNRKKSKRQKKGNSDWFLYLSLYSDSKDGARTVLLLTLWTLGIYSQYKKHSAYMHVSLCNDYIIHKRIEGQKYLTDPRQSEVKKTENLAHQSTLQCSICSVEDSRIYQAYKDTKPWAVCSGKSEGSVGIYENFALIWFIFKWQLLYYRELAVICNNDHRRALSGSNDNCVFKVMAVQAIN